MFKYLTKTSLVNVISNKSNYSIQFNHKIKIHRNRVYFLLVQVFTNNSVNLLTNSDSENASLVYPLCKSFIGNLSELSKFSVPTDYISMVCPCGNLY